MKKGQAAMEFLMTYGWAILVVLIAIGALAYFGVLNPEKFLPEKCVIASGSGLFCEDFSTSSASNEVKFRIKNILTEKVIVSKIELDEPSCVDSAGGEIKADSVGEFTLSCSALESKQKIKGNIIITYKKASSNFIKSTTGSLTTIVA